ncbi:MAG TPA: acyl-CoA synthetase [Thermodesulfobacteriota bacterium]|nr:acyl-CoA synthetase [Thermodesulfobacteriota bacterium]
MERLEFFDRLASFENDIAIIDRNSSYSYEDLLASSGSVASGLLSKENDLREKRVAFLIPSSFEYAAVMLGIWRAGGIAVPLCVSHPDPELDYVIENSGAGFVIASPEFEGRLSQLAELRNARLIRVADALSCQSRPLPGVSEARRAMIIYTSGTTSRPKGVVTTHENLKAKIGSLVEAWEWSPSDFILNVLPLHHLHGIMNVLLCALYSGARCEMMQGFDPRRVWEKFMERDYTLFMAVPTIYSRLIRSWDEAGDREKKLMAGACRRMRLMVSGSAALPVSTLERWREISGHVLLERYGMTETGMALSNPLRGDRQPGRVGTPLPGVDVRLIDEGGRMIGGDGAGEIVVRGKNVFLEYWNNPEATNEGFMKGGWFMTGDIAERDAQDSYRILGRKSVDIIKSGGYKISALEIEEVLRAHPDIEECAVVGLEDKEWGERVCAALVLSRGGEVNLQSLREWCRERLAQYKIPSRIITVGELPRNQMGKVMKPGVIELFRDI